MQRIAALEYRAGVNLSKSLRIDAKEFCVAVLGATGGKTQLAFQIENPARDALGVLPNEGLLPRGTAELVKIVPGFVAIVQTDVDGIRIALRRCIQYQPHAFETGQIAGRRRLGTGRGLGRRINRISIVVFISVVVLDVDDVLAVPAPEKSRDGTLAFGGQQSRRAERFIDSFHVNIAGVVPGLEKRNVLSIRRKFRSRNFRIAKDDVPVDQGWSRRLICLGNRGRNEEKKRHNGGEELHTTNPFGPSRA